MLPKLVLLAMAVWFSGACDLALGPPSAPPCPPDCILTVEAPDTVDIADSVAVSARVTNLRGDPVPGVLVHWTLQLRLPCWRCYLDPGRAFVVLAEVSPGHAVTGAGGRAMGSVVLPAEGHYTLTARIESDSSGVRQIFASYPAGANWQVEWTSLRDMPVAFQGSASTQLGSRVFVMEGTCGSMHLPTGCLPRGGFSPGPQYMDIYEVGTDTWSLASRPPAVPEWRQRLETGYENLAVAANLDGTVHLIRGLAHHAYDPATDLWTERAPPPGSARQPRLETTAGRLFLIGTGQDQRGVHAYDPATDVWDVMTAMPSGRESMASAVVDGLIYVAGGTNFSPGGGIFDTLERYNPTTDAWDVLPPMPLRRYGLRAGAVGRLFCVFGGGLATLRAGHGFRETYCYDTVAGSWSLGPPMPWHDVILVAAAGDGLHVYAFGGGYHTPAGDMTQVPDAARLSAR